MDQNTQQLPHLVVEDEHKRSPWAIVGIVTLSITLLAIPLGIYLVGQRTQLAPQAAVATPAPEAPTSIFLESRLSPDSGGGVIPVDVFIKSTQDPLNLANVKFKFDPSFLSVDNIATGAAEPGKNQIFTKWLEASSNDEKGEISIIAGVPNPGILSSDVPEGKVYLATLNLRPKKSGTAVLQIGSNSELLRNSDNQNIFQSATDLVLNLPNQVPSATPVPSAKSQNNQPLIVITNPVTAANYSYFTPLDIIWSSFNVEIISQINLLVNGVLYGPIGENVDPATGKYTWNPQDSLSIPYIQSANTFSIEIVGLGKDGETVRAHTGPFGLVGSDTVSGLAPNLTLFLQNQLSVADASKLLANYLGSPVADKALDFNRDDIINELDFYLLKQNLTGRGIIK